LNHPNILAIHDFGSHDGVAYAVTELLEGETLRSRLEGGAALSPRRAIDTAIQIARGLAAAHEKGVIHRDMKPENLFLTRDGRVKILDFGLAKVIGRENAQTSAPTTPPGTEPGTVMGTVGYMSPEQVRGRELDHRTDIFSFGAILYEMLSGRRAFKGDSHVETMNAILKEEPPELSESGRNIAPALDRIVRHCLEKSPEARFHSASDVAFDLEALSSSSSASAAHEKPAGPSVAVLYFENLSRASEDEYFRDGMTEDITTELAKIKSLRVFPRAAISSYRDKAAPAREVGEQLGATHVLGGSLRRAGDRLRITVQMVETRSGHSVWAERYDREMRDVFEVQEEIARSIAQALRLTLTSEEDETIARKPTANLNAYDYFLRGRSYTRQQRRAFALELFDHALALDPSFALAHAGIANVCAMQYYLEDHQQRWLDRAITACDRAFELEPRLPEAFVARARILYAQGQYGEAVESARTAIAIKHDCETAWDILGRALFASDRWEEAAGLVESAVEANGEDYNVYISYGNALKALGREDAARSLRDRQDRALERQLEWVPEDTRARMLLACGHAMAGRKEDALRELEKVLSLGVSDPHTIYNAACVYGSLNMKEEAMPMLLRAVAAGYAEWDSLARDPDLACLHDEAEFQQLLAASRPQTDA
jgi:non-specific serine/threonine protein kinase